jgi:hypothetical protein
LAKDATCPHNPAVCGHKRTRTWSPGCPAARQATTPQSMYAVDCSALHCGLHLRWSVEWVVRGRDLGVAALFAAIDGRKVVMSSVCTQQCACPYRKTRLTSAHLCDHVMLQLSPQSSRTGVPKSVQLPLQLPPHHCCLDIHLQASNAGPYCLSQSAVWSPPVVCTMILCP